MTGARGFMTLERIAFQIGDFVLRKSAGAGGIAVLFWQTLASLLKANVKETIKQMAKLGVDSLPIVLMTTTAAGMVFAVQTAQEFAKLGASESVGGIVAIAMGRELVPILVGVVVAGRVGAAITAEIGSMKVTEQIDALRVMAVSPVVYLAAPRFWACALMMPVLGVFANIVGTGGGYCVAHLYAGITYYSYLNSIKYFCVPFDLIGGLIKCVVFGGIIAVVGCHKGLSAVAGAEGVGVATTGSVVLSIIMIFIANYFLSVLLYV
jgi:phospholipid/cholesterol/gamma-HCH transport system permease protein